MREPRNSTYLDAARPQSVESHTDSFEDQQPLECASMEHRLGNFAASLGLGRIGAKHGEDMSPRAMSVLRDQVPADAKLLACHSDQRLFHRVGPGRTRIDQAFVQVENDSTDRWHLAGDSEFRASRLVLVRGVDIQVAEFIGFQLSE